MEKFLKISLSGAYHLIPIKNILGIEVGVDTKVNILYNSVGHRATGASEVLGVELVATTAADAAKTKEQLVSIVDAIEKEGLPITWDFILHFETMELASQILSTQSHVKKKNGESLE